MSFKEYISLRKINTVILIVILLLLLDHALESFLYLIGITPYSPSLKATGRRLFLWVLLHIIISLYLYLKDKYLNRKYSKYTNIRNDTQIQIISGIAIILFAILHILTYTIMPVNLMGSNIVYIHLIIDNLLFCSLMVHLTISLPRLMVSLGFLTEENSYQKFSQRISLTFKLIFIILLFSEILYYLL